MKRFCFSAFLCIALFVLTACGDSKDLFKQPLDSEVSYDSYVLALNDDFNADIVVLGDDKYLDPRLNYRMIDTLNEKNLEYDDDVCGYQAIVLLDMDGGLKLNDADFEFLYDCVVNKNKDFIYLGTGYPTKFEQLFSISGNAEYPGFGVYGCYPNEEGHRGFGIVNGIWTEELNSKYKEEKTALPFVIAYELYSNASGESYSW